MINEIKLIKYADTFLAEDQIFKGGETGKLRPIIFGIYFVKTNNRLILIDAGCETMPGFDMRNFVSPAAALTDTTGILPEKITDVIITHSHHDHIHAVFRFPNAVIHIQKDEYESGKCHIPENFKLNIFEDTFSLEEDLKIIKIGGHSKGSCIVEALFNGEIYVICGDECYTRENLIKKIPTGCSFNPINSENFIQKYSDSKYHCLLCHD